MCYCCKHNGCSAYMRENCSGKFSLVWFAECQELFTERARVLLQVAAGLGWRQCVNLIMTSQCMLVSCQPRMSKSQKEAAERALAAASLGCSCPRGWMKRPTPSACRNGCSWWSRCILMVSPGPHYFLHAPPESAPLLCWPDVTWCYMSFVSSSSTYAELVLLLLLMSYLTAIIADGQAWSPLICS